MPELPEVETVVRTLSPHIRDCVFNGASVLRASCIHPQSMPLDSLIGMRIINVRRRGKLIVMDLVPQDKNTGDIPACVVVHLRMTGRVFTREANDAQGCHTRCIFDLRRPDNTDMRLFFDDTRTFGKIFVATVPLLEQWPFWSEMGPEPLEMDALELGQCLRGNRAIKAALLDQKVIAGIGNIYADESLFQSRILPTRPAGSLTAAELKRLMSAIKDVLNRSIAQCGSSIRDYRDADGNVGAFQNSFRVYGRGGKKCLKCGEILQKCRIGGRATVFCPVCQK